MADRTAPQAEADLDDIWHRIATESGSMEAANRLIDAISDRFFLLGRYPYIGRARDKDFGAGPTSSAMLPTGQTADLS